MRSLRPYGVYRYATITGLVALAVAGPLTGQANTGQDRAWGVVEMFRLGGLDAPEEQEFTNQLLSLSIGPNDQLFVLDLSASRIQVFSAQEGEFVRTISRPGRGPGEISDATSLGWDAEGRLWVKEPFARRFSVFDSTGTFIRTVPRPWAPVPKRTGRVEFDADGRVVEMVLEASELYLRALDPESGDVVEEYARFRPPQVSESVRRAFFTAPNEAQEAVRRFQPRLVWDWVPDGGVWIARQDDYRVAVVDARGDTLTVIEGLGPPREFSRAEEALVEQARHHLGADDQLFAPPQIQSLVRLSDGHLLVQRPEEMNDPGRRYEIFAPGGEYVGELVLPLPVWPGAGVATQDDRLFVVGRGEYDVPIVLALRVVP